MIPNKKFEDNRKKPIVGQWYADSNYDSEQRVEEILLIHVIGPRHSKAIRKQGEKGQRLGIDTMKFYVSREGRFQNVKDFETIDRGWGQHYNVAKSSDFQRFIRLVFQAGEM